MHGPALHRSRFLCPLFTVSGIGLVAASWLNAASFGIYIAVSFILDLLVRRLGWWNRNLPGLYAPGALIQLSWLPSPPVSLPAAFF